MMRVGVALLILGLFSIPQPGQAEQSKIAAQSATKSKKMGRRVRKKIRHRRKSPRNLLHPFTLRLLYTPSYRFLSKQMQTAITKNKDNDIKTEVVQFFPIAAGLEGEFAFNNWLSLVMGGNFSWQNKFITYNFDKAIESAAAENVTVPPSSVPNFNYKYHELVAWTSLYFNAYDYFKIGGGVEIHFATLSMSAESSDPAGDTYKLSSEASRKRVSAHLALRRDFFLPHIGVGVGLNVSMPVTKTFARQTENRKYVNDKLVEDKGNAGDNTTSPSSSNDDDNEDIFKVVLMPVLYFTL